MSMSTFLPINAKLHVLEAFTCWKGDSGYSSAQIRHCITAELVTFSIKLQRSRFGVPNLHRGRREYTEGRYLRREVERIPWFFVRTDHGTSIPTSRTASHDLHARRPKRPRYQWPKKSNNPQQPVAVLFAPRTLGENLLQSQRADEASLDAAGLGGYRRILVVELGGLKLKHLLTTAEPWSKEPCQRVQCSTCLVGDEALENCKRRSYIYKNKFIICEKSIKILVT